MGYHILKTFALAPFWDGGRGVFDGVLDREALFTFFKGFSEGIVNRILCFVKYFNPFGIFSRTVVLGRGGNEALMRGWRVENLNEAFPRFVIPFCSDLVGFLVIRKLWDVELQKLLKNVHSLSIMFFLHEWVPSTDLACFFVWLAVHIYSKK